MPSFHDQDLFRSLGLHRDLEPKGVLPRPAWKLDNTPIVHAAETLVDVDTLHIDSASFFQITQVGDRYPERIKGHIQEIVAQCGKRSIHLSWMRCRELYPRFEITL